MRVKMRTERISEGDFDSGGVEVTGSYELGSNSFSATLCLFCFLFIFQKL